MKKSAYPYSTQFTSDPPAITVNRATKWQEVRHNVERIIAGTAPQPYMVMTFEDLDTAKKAVAAIYSFSHTRKITDKVGRRLDSTNNTVVVWNKQTTEAPPITF